MKAYSFLVLLCAAFTTLALSPEENSSLESQSLARRGGLDSKCEAQARGTSVTSKRTVEHCGVMGTIVGPKSGVITRYGYTQQDCADLCVCRSSTNHCKTYGFKLLHGDKGECVVYPHHLERMHYEAGTSPDSISTFFHSFVSPATHH